MNSRKIFVLGAVIVVLAIAMSGSPFFILSEGQQAIVTQFGMPVGGAYTSAGFNFKLPFIQKVTYFEKRLLEWDGYPTQIPTKDKKYIWVDTTARWRISDPLRFFQSVNDERGAHARLDDIVDAAVRDAVTAHNLIELVRSSNRIIDERDEAGTEEFAEEGALEKIKVGRDKIREEIISRSRELAPQYGIELLDVRVKRVTYVEEVRRKVYERMIAERKRAAEEYRSEGRGIRADIEGRTEKELKGILSQAYKEAQSIKGEADARAVQIYADAYSKDPAFYGFIKTMDTYRNTVDANTTVVLTTDAEYFSYLKALSDN